MILPKQQAGGDPNKVRYLSMIAVSKDYSLSGAVVDFALPVKTAYRRCLDPALIQLVRYMFVIGTYLLPIYQGTNCCC